VRNYVLSNTTEVFQSSYQTLHVREDLTKLAFGAMAGRNDTLFQNLRSISLRRDADAPVDPSREDLLVFEERKDVRDLRVSIEQCEDKRVRKLTQCRLDNLIKTLSCLRVQEKRATYFNRVDSLRAQGLSSVNSAKECTPESTTSVKLGNVTAAAVARFMQSCTNDVDESFPVEQRSKAYMELLGDYLAHRPQLIARSVSKSSRSALEDKAENKDEADSGNDDGSRKRSKPSRCLLGCGRFRSRSELTKHYLRAHIKNGTFDQPVSCQECHNEGMDVVIKGGPSAWSNHVETVHGKIHTPNLPSCVCPNKESSLCLLCGHYFLQGGGLTRHIRRAHVENEGIFNRPFQCPECLRLRLGDQCIFMDGISAWYDHVASTHSDVGFPLLQPKGQKSRKRKHDENDMVAGLEAEAAVAVVSNGVEDMTTTNTADIRPDPWTGLATSGSEIPPSSISLEIDQKIDPRFEPMILSTESLHHLPDTVLEVFGDSIPCRESDNLLSDTHDHGDALQVHRQPRAELSHSPTPALLVDPGGLRIDIAERYWGKGYALVPAGSEPDRCTNNARKRREISSNICSEHVIHGKRRRTPKNKFA
jgi:hypothetical protein